MLTLHKCSYYVSFSVTERAPIPLLKCIWKFPIQAHTALVSVWRLELTALECVTSCCVASNNVPLQQDLNMELRFRNGYRNQQCRLFNPMRSAQVEHTAKWFSDFYFYFLLLWWHQLGGPKNTVYQVQSINLI